MRDVYEFDDGDVVFWVGEGGGSIMLKVINRFGDPAELSVEEALRLADKLREVALKHR